MYVPARRKQEKKVQQVLSVKGDARVEIPQRAKRRVKNKKYCAAAVLRRKLMQHDF